MSWLIAFLVPWGVFALWWAVRALGAAKTVRREPLSSLFGHRLFFVAGGVLLSYTPHSLSYPLWPSSRPLAIGALGLECVGIAFAIWAREHLGRLWSGRITLKEGHRIVKSGPYRLARHPIYTGLLVGICAVVMVRGTLAAAVALVLFLIGFTRKILGEERLLTAEFGDEYRQYQKQVKALVPFLI